MPLARCAAGVAAAAAARMAAPSPLLRSRAARVTALPPQPRVMLARSRARCGMRRRCLLLLARCSLHLRSRSRGGASRDGMRRLLRSHACACVRCAGCSALRWRVRHKVHAACCCFNMRFMRH
jgi:hypothetical protein